MRYIKAKINICTHMELGHGCCNRMRMTIYQVGCVSTGPLGNEWETAKRNLGCLFGKLQRLVVSLVQSWWLASGSVGQQLYFKTKTLQCPCDVSQCLTFYEFYEMDLMYTLLGISTLPSQCFSLLEAFVLVNDEHWCWGKPQKQW